MDEPVLDTTRMEVLVTQKILHLPFFFFFWSLYSFEYAAWSGSITDWIGHNSRATDGVLRPASNSNETPKSMAAILCGGSFSLLGIHLFLVYGLYFRFEVYVMYGTQTAVPT